ncbi:MAG: hypothetical protein H6Q35_2511 [Proteobacteria bacterium]|nr:hypothetical protein [Pseudomonadota bacterium]MBS1230933.1 hypothetical protein [Pseudomonadota bacterium]
MNIESCKESERLTKTPETRPPIDGLRSTEMSAHLPRHIRQKTGSSCGFLSGTQTSRSQLFSIDRATGIFIGHE